MGVSIIIWVGYDIHHSSSIRYYLYPTQIIIQPQGLQQMIKEHWKTRQRDALSGAIKTKGYLYKKSNSLISHYQKRFFIVNNDYLAYYQDQTLDSLKNKISLTAITQISPVNQLEFTFFSKQKNKKYQIKAETKSHRDQWISSLIVIQQFLSLSNRKTLIELKEPEHETQFQTNIRATLRSLSLNQLSKQYHQDYIKCRVIGHMTTKGCLFLVSCKSLVKEIKDEIILDKEYVFPKQFNVVYLHDPKTNSCEKIINCQQIQQVVLTARTLRINNIRLNVEEDKDTEFTARFIQRLKHSIVVGQEYRNKKGIVLRQNIDYLVELFQKESDRLQKQHIEIKLEDQYIGVMVNNHKHYKRNFSKFKLLIKQLITQIEDTLNAIQLKKQNLKELSILYVNFYYQKIYKLLQLFWSQNYDTMAIADIIHLTGMSISFHNTISRYVSDGSLLINGTKLLRDVYVKKILGEIQGTLKDLIKNQEIQQSKQTTFLPMEFTRIIKWKFKMIDQHCECEQMRQQSKSLLIEAATLVLINVLENKIQLLKCSKSMLIVFCNDVWKYSDHLKQAFPALDLTEVLKCLSKFQGNIIKKLYTYYFSSQPAQYNIIQTEFLKVKVEEYVEFAKKEVGQLENLDPRSKQQIQDRMGENFNTYYWRSLMNSCSKTVVFQSAIQEMVDKIKSDCSKAKSIFSKSNVLVVECLFKNIVHLLQDKQTDDRIKQIYTQLKSVIINQEFRQNDVVVLLKLKNTRTKEQLDSLISTLGQLEVAESDIDHQINLPQSQSGLRLNKQVSQISEAELLLSNDIRLESYLKRKKIEIYNTSGGYNLEYFKLTSEYLLWYTNPNSTSLIDRILLADVKEVYLHPKSPSKFYIDLKNGIRYKFKTSSIDSAIKWVEHINLSSLRPKPSDSKRSELKNIPDQQIFNNYFQQIQEKDLSSRISNIRDYKPSKLTTKESSSMSPVKKSNKTPEKRKLGLNKKFGCVDYRG